MPDSKQEGVSGRKPPNAGMGRRAGSPNKTTTALKEAILLAAEETGMDGQGKGGLKGYLRLLATTQPKSFAALLGRVLPLQVTGEGGGPLVVAATTHDQAL